MLATGANGIEQASAASMPVLMAAWLPRCGLTFKSPRRNPPGRRQEDELGQAQQAARRDARAIAERWPA